MEKNKKSRLETAKRIIDIAHSYDPLSLSESDLIINLEFAGYYLSEIDKLELFDQLRRCEGVLAVNHIFRNENGENSSYTLWVKDEGDDGELDINKLLITEENIKLDKTNATDYIVNFLETRTKEGKGLPTYTELIDYLSKLKASQYPELITSNRKEFIQYITAAIHIGRINRIQLKKGQNYFEINKDV